MEYRTCKCGRRYKAQDWKTEEERSKCFTCYVRQHWLEDTFRGRLTAREQKIIDTRFGITDYTPRTLEETGKIFGVTRERIRQIEAKATMILEKSL